MLYHILSNFTAEYHALNVVRYITFRSILAVFTALIISFLSAPQMIKLLKSTQKGGQPIRDDGPESHITMKKGTPTMGGVMMIFAILASTIMWADCYNQYIWICIFVLLSFAMIGFIDDYKKLKYKNSHGMSARLKFSLQCCFSLLAIFFVNKIACPTMQNMLFIPFCKNFALNLGVFYLIFTSFVVVGSSNAVNLTDGLDGLATFPVLVAAGCLALISYITGNTVFAHYLQLPYVNQVGELAIFCASIIGACLGFLWYNAPPARVFMGDIGSLSLGAALGIISVIIKQEIVLLIISGVFVMETMSVILQVLSYKTRKKRIFKMAPIHHHFEKLGWSESTIVIRFWILSLIFALIGLTTLKLR